MAKRAAQQEAVDPGVIIQLDPTKVLADDNTRFNLKESRIQSLADSILSQGGVIEPVEVEPIEEGSNNGFTHRLTVGFYRLAAVKYLNTTQAAGLTIPALVHINLDSTTRLKRQLAENIERENQSPMDCAIAIQRLMDAGIPRIEIRQMFSRPGSRKGAKGKPEPASNAWMNMMLSFLDLSKSEQEKVHTGILPVGSAYRLTLIEDKEKRAQILAKAEDERKKVAEQEEKEEERFLAQEKQAIDRAEKVGKAKADLEQSEARSKQTSEILEKQTNLTAELFKVWKGKHNTPKDKKAADSAFKEADKQRTVAEADANDAQKKYEAAQMVYSKLTEEKKVKEKKLADDKAKKEKVSPADITKAAKDVGANVGAVPLNAAEMRRVVIEMGLPTGDKQDEKMKALSTSLTNCFAGITTPDQLYREVKKLLGK